MKRMPNHTKAQKQKSVEPVPSGPHAGQASIRKAYEALGVQDFYASHGARYTNPHEEQILAALWQLLDSTPAAVWLGLRELPTSAHSADAGGDGDEGSDDDGGDGATDPHTNSLPSNGQLRANAGPSAGPAAPTAPVTAGTAPAAAAAARAEAAAAAATAVTAGLHPPVPLRVLDLACGSGEVTAAIIAWNHSRTLPPSTKPAAADVAVSADAAVSTVRDCTAAVTASSNPPHPRPQHQHHQQRQRARLNGTRGSGAGGVVLPYDLHITACDPYTGAAYAQRTGRAALPWSFEDIADGCLADWQQQPPPALSPAAAAAAPPRRLPGTAAAAAVTGPASATAPAPAPEPAPEPLKFDLVVCSFALHLCEPTRLYGTLTALSLAGRWLVVLAPHKRPVVTAEHGWGLAAAWRRDRTHVRLYRSLRVLGPEAAEAGLCA